MTSEVRLDQFTVPLDVTIRFCREADLPRLEWFGAFSHHRGVIREAFELQGRGQAVMLVAEAAGFPAGQAWLDLRPKAGAEGPMVWAVRVLDPLRGTGVGTRLMAALEAVARERGHERLELGVERANPRARAFYEGLGWRVARERRESYSYTTPEGQTVAHTLDEWVMIKDLGQAGGSRPTRA